MLIPLLLVMLAINAREPVLDLPTRCSIWREGPEPTPADGARSLLRHSDVVLHVRAGSYLVGAPVRERTQGDWIRFEVLEVLKGSPSLRYVPIHGVLVEQSDFNHGSVPYAAVRRSGQRGSCYAEQYQRDGEFLLLLRERGGILTPYWAPLAPTNEQIHGSADPWIAWVRTYL